MPPAPTAPAAPMTRTPTTTSDPTNAGAGLPPATGNVVQQVSALNTQLAQALKQAGEKNTEWFEELQEGQQQIIHALSVMLRAQLYIAEQTMGTDAATLAKLLVHTGDAPLTAFMQIFESEGGEGNG